MHFIPFAMILSPLETFGGLRMTDELDAANHFYPGTQVKVKHREKRNTPAPYF